MATLIQFRRDNEQNWAFENPILAQGEPGLNLTTYELKIGDGVTAWNDLEYFSANQVEVMTKDINQEYPLVFSSNTFGQVELYTDANGGTYNPFTNVASIDISGNAFTATKLLSPRNIVLSGDVSGSVSFDGSQNVTITTTIEPNSVSLGTDTTGNYVASASVSGNGLTGSATGEGSSFTVTSNATSANTANTIVFRDAVGNFAANSITANNVTVNQSLTLNQGTTLSTGPIIIENVFLIDTTSSSSTTQVPYIIDAFDVSEYRTAKYLVQITRGMEYHSTEVLVVHNDTIAQFTEYGTVFTDVELGAIGTEVNSGEVRLTFNPYFTNTVVRVVRHTIKVS